MRVRIDDPDYGAIGRRFVAFERKRRFFAATPKNQFALARTDCIKCDGRTSLWFEIRVQRLDDKELASVEIFVLNGRDYGSDDAGYLHLKNYA